MPVLAFGNSGSDTSMMNYTLDDRNPYPSRAYMVVADDNVREWGTQDWDEKSTQYREQGYVPISMKNDFLRIYPETVTRADVQYLEKDIDAQSDKAADSNIIPFPVGTASEDYKNGSFKGFATDDSILISPA